MERIVIGTRGSRLALWQAHEVRRAIERVCRGDRSITVEIEVISTRGDERLDIALHSNTLSKGLFTYELEDRLREGSIDIAVHSLKDLPVEMPEGLALAGVLPRGEVRDVVVANAPDVQSLTDLAGARVGTSSPRRIAQLQYHLRRLGLPAAECLPVRGNVETRIAKLRRGEYDALVMAGAGLVRLGLEEQISFFLPMDQMLPAPGQGAVALQTATHNEQATALARAVSDEPTYRATEAERALLQSLGGGCALPMACLCELGERSEELAGTTFYTPTGAGGAGRYLSFVLPRDYGDEDLGALARQLDS